jgi:geranylgeranyl reductase family protein
MNFDAVVVGAGPGGAFSAYWLAKNGLKVLLLEKKRLPRFKLCGGCLSARVVSLLPEGWQGLIKAAIREGTLGYRGEESFSLPSEKPLAYIVDRAEFDYFLVQKAQQVGVELWQECELLGFEEGERIKVYTSKGEVEADFLIGADGFYSKTAYLLGYKKKKFFRSLEFQCLTNLKEGVRIDVGLVEKGYAWVFPTNVGIASTGKENLLELLRDYSTKLGLKVEGKVYGWHIPYLENKKDFHAGRGRILLVGDASNSVDPLLGEGIYYALWGAKNAVRAILNCPNNPVEEYFRLSKPMIEELVYAGRIAKIAYRFQRFSYNWGKKGALKAYYRLLRGEERYKKLFFKAWLHLI